LGFYVVTSTSGSILADSIEHIQSAVCDSGDHAVGGGFSSSRETNVYKALLTNSKHVVTGYNTDPFSWSLGVTVTCADTALPAHTP